MRKLVVAVACSLSMQLHAGKFPDVNYSPPTDWHQSVFELSQSYPDAPTESPRYAWTSIDFRTKPERYGWAVLDYCFEGNTNVDFVVQRNAIRQWYHAPWLHEGQNAREFVHGLTGERNSRPYELWATQTASYKNVAVGFYNEPGGIVIGKVWKDPDNPDTSIVSFPDGTVSCKLLFTTASVSVVPYLSGSPEWVADLDRSPDSNQIMANKVRLLQIDIAVKDSRSSKGGWIFGTFHYDAAVASPDPWRRLKLLTLMWGDDPTLTPSRMASGGVPVESWINPSSPIVIYRNNPPAGISAPKTLGWAGRGNGPVDSPTSSCLSCHGTAQTPRMNVGMTAPPNLPESDKLRWFRNLTAGESFSQGASTLDFSLQLGVGLENWQNAKVLIPVQPSVNPKEFSKMRKVPISQGVKVFSRDPNEPTEDK